MAGECQKKSNGGMKAERKSMWEVAHAISS